jgi:hypothetical protein
MAVDDKDALRACAQLVADKAKELFDTWSKRASATVRISVRSGTARVTAGNADTPEVFFAQVPRNRAPAWANRKSPWHYTGYHDSLSEAGEQTLDEVSSKYTDIMLPKLLDDSGL